MGEPLEDADVEICRRVPVPRGDPKNIVVQFVRPNKTKCLSWKKKTTRKRKTYQDVGLATTGPVFVNEHSPPPIRKLLGQVILKKKEHDRSPV